MSCAAKDKNVAKTDEQLFDEMEECIKKAVKVSGGLPVYMHPEYIKNIEQNVENLYVAVEFEVLYKYLNKALELLYSTLFPDLRKTTAKMRGTTSFSDMFEVAATWKQYRELKDRYSEGAINIAKEEKLPLFSYLKDEPLYIGREADEALALMERLESIFGFLGTNKSVNLAAIRNKKKSFCDITVPDICPAKDKNEK